MHSDEETLYDPTLCGADDETDTEPIFRVDHDNTTGSSLADDETGSFSSVTTDSPTPTPKFSRFSKRFCLEPTIFLVFLAINLSGTVTTNKILYQTCVAVFEYNETDCEPLLGVIKPTENTQHIESIVQPYAARILMVRSLLESIVPAVVSLFVGPWSDKFGRRPVFLVSCAAYLFSFIILSTLTLISNNVPISPWLFLLTAVPGLLSGGMCAFITVFCSYITDVADGRARIMRMWSIDIALGGGISLGSFASGYIYGASNVFTVFLISTILMGAALIFVYFLIEESLKQEQIQPGPRIREFFRLELFKGLMTTCFKRRSNFDRTILWCTLTANTFSVFTMQGDVNVFYLFLRKKFEWTVKDYSMFSALNVVVQAVGGVFGIVVLRMICKLSIVTMTMLALGCAVMENTVRATAAYSWELYLGMGMGFMRSIAGPLARTILSNVVPASEVGKIFAMASSLEALSPVGASPLYTTVYNATFEFYPGLYNFISAGLYLISFGLMATVVGIELRQSYDKTIPYQAIES